MQKPVLQAAHVLVLLFVCLVLALSQKTDVGYEKLLQQYKHAQQRYDSATSLSNLHNYGPKEEALEKKWNTQALTGFRALFQQITPARPDYDSLRFHAAFKIGELQHYFENYAEAINFYQQAIAIKERSALADSLLFKPLLYVGIIFYNQNKFDTAIRFFNRAEAVQALYNNQLTEAERLYNLLGVLHYERGNYRQAKNYVQKALALLPASNPYYEELFVNYRINLAQLHMRLEEYDRADAIYRDLLPRKINLNEIYHNIGTLNLSLGAVSKAIASFKKVSYQNNKIVRLYNSLGQAYFNLLQNDSAHFYYQKAISANLLLGANADHVGHGLALKNLGDYHQRLKNYDQALTFYQKAIQLFYPAFTTRSVLENPERFSGVFSYINLFNTLHAKAEAWHALYLQNNDRKAADEELKVYRAAFRLTAYVERTYDSDEARLFLAKIKHSVHGKPIDTAFELYRKTKDKAYLSILYLFDQQNKAAILALNRQMNNVLSESNSPLLQKQQEAKAQITRLSIRAAQLTDSAQLAVINSKIRDREIELGKIQENLHAGLLINEGELPTISALQTSLLNHKTALVSYHLAPGKLTTLVITKKAVDCYQQTLPANFLELVQKEILYLKTPSEKPSLNRNPSFYQLFLASVPLEGLQELIIVPDDILAYIPFESLQDSKGRFLIQDVAVQYQFSTALLKKNGSDFANAKTLSFAPFANQTFTDSFPVLPASAQEVAATQGQRFVDTTATKEMFLRYSGDYDIVHLATHAVASTGADNLSYIVFSTGNRKDPFLYAKEIYNLRLRKTRLVVLSACETGSGSLVEGEGVLSMSRAFAYAGCPNILTSLWKADDFSTAYITSRIREYLNEGLSVSKAVQQSKLDYLKDKRINPRLKQPYYWSHLVFIGNVAPDENNAWIPFAIAGFAGLLAFFLYTKKSAGAEH